MVILHPSSFCIAQDGSLCNTGSLDFVQRSFFCMCTNLLGWSPPPPTQPLTKLMVWGCGAGRIAPILWGGVGGPSKEADRQKSFAYITTRALSWVDAWRAPSMRGLGGSHPFPTNLFNIERARQRASRIFPPALPYHNKYKGRNLFVYRCKAIISQTC